MHFKKTNVFLVRAICLQYKLHLNIKIGQIEIGFVTAQSKSCLNK